MKHSHTAIASVTLAVVLTAFGATSTQSMTAQVSQDSWVRNVLCGVLHFCSTETVPPPVTKPVTTSTVVVPTVVTPSITAPTPIRPIPPIEKPYVPITPAYCPPSDKCGDGVCGPTETATAVDGSLWCSQDCQRVPPSTQVCDPGYSCLINGSTSDPDSPYKVAYECGNMPNSPVHMETKGTCTVKGYTGRCVACIPNTTPLFPSADVPTGAGDSDVMRLCMSADGIPISCDDPGCRGAGCTNSNEGQNNPTPNICTPPSCANPPPGKQWSKAIFDSTGCMTSCGILVDINTPSAGNHITIGSNTYSFGHGGGRVEVSGSKANTDGSIAAAVITDINGTKLHRCITSTELCTPFFNHSANIHFVTDDGKIIYSALGTLLVDNTVIAGSGVSGYELRKGSVIPLYKDAGYIQFISVSADGNTVAFLAEDETLTPLSGGRRQFSAFAFQLRSGRVVKLDQYVGGPIEVSADGRSITYSKTTAGSTQMITKEVNFAPPSATCGDGRCGGDDTFESCPLDCRPYCGNNIVEPGETCDLGSKNTGYGSPCGNLCETGEWCGDGKLQSLYGEDCDDAAANGTPGHCPYDCKRR